MVQLQDVCTIHLHVSRPPSSASRRQAMADVEEPGSRWIGIGAKLFMCAWMVLVTQDRSMVLDVARGRRLVDEASRVIGWHAAGDADAEFAERTSQGAFGVAVGVRPGQHVDPRFRPLAQEV